MGCVPAAVARPLACLLFFFNDTATTEIYTLSLHDALPISARRAGSQAPLAFGCRQSRTWARGWPHGRRSEEHTSELQSQSNLVCRLLLEKKKPRRLAPPALSRRPPPPAPPPLTRDRASALS